VIVRRIVDAFYEAERPRELRLDARLRRARLRDVHTVRAMEHLRTGFTNPRLNLREVADKCRISAPYLSHLLSANTNHGFRKHLGGLRLLYAAHQLATTALSIEEVVDRSGFNNTAALDHGFKKFFHMTPGEFRRWGT
jgi:AraC-like DNA-binding protein